jgi:hypothetical protein
MKRSAIGQFDYGHKNHQDGKTVACFESWFGGKSSLYLASIDGEDAIRHFVNDHFHSGSDSILRRFDDEMDARITYAQY